MVEITQEPGKSFLDRMIALVEGAESGRPQRDRPGDPARRPDAGLRPGDRLAEALRALRGHAALGDDPDRPAGGADPDHDRGAALGDRDRRHGPPGAPERAGPLGPGSRGLGGLRRPAARQDGHDHPRKPRGDRVHPDARSLRITTSPRQRRCPRWPTRPRRAARSWCWPRASACASTTSPVTSPISSRSAPRRG